MQVVFIKGKTIPSPRKPKALTDKEKFMRLVEECRQERLRHDMAKAEKLVAPVKQEIERLTAMRDELRLQVQRLNK